MSLHVPTKREVVGVLDDYLPVYNLEVLTGIVVNDWYLSDDDELILEAERDGTLCEIRISVSVDPR